LATTPWLQTKLLLFGAVLAFELLDIWVAHVLFRRLLLRGAAASEAEWQAAGRWRTRVALLAIPVGGLLVPAILYLAIAKP
jgi:hypothetical protein